MAGSALTLLGVLYLWYCFASIRRREKAEQAKSIPEADPVLVNPEKAHHVPAARGVN